MKCSAFWNYVNVRPGNRVYPCCRFKQPVATFKGDLEQIINGPEYIELRERNTTGDYIPECQKCFDEEALGHKSLRMKLNEEYTFDTPAVKFLEIGMDNLCNLVCDGCNSEFSSSWIIKEKQLYGAPLNKKLSIDEVDNIPDTIEKILFLGGEPLITDKHLSVLKLHPNPSKCRVIYNTNCSYMPKLQWEQQWSKFKSVHFILSVDGVAEINEKVRGGSVWQDTLDFIEYCKLNNYTFEFNTVLHRNNWFDLTNLVNFMNEYNDWYINLLTYPKNLALNTLSTTELHTFLQKAESLTFPNKIYILNYVKDILNNRL
jgi:sulfatase maturation enzyme AslB (radical SAM superfamily)